MAGFRSRHRYRCRPCRKKGSAKNHGHFTLRKSPTQLAKKGRVPKCPRCRSDDVADMEFIRRRAVAKRRDTCYCAGVPHPHTHAKHLLCVHFPHEHLIFHWPRDYPGTLEREQDLEERSEDLWNPHNGKHRRGKTR